MPSNRARSFGRALVAAVVLGASLCVAPGCGYLKANFAQTYVWTRELDAYVITRPPAEVLEKATTVRGPHDTLFYRGQSTFTDVSPTVKRSGRHREESPGSGDKTVSFSVIEIEVVPVSNGCQARFTEIVDSTTSRDGKVVSTNHTRDRRLDLELELVTMLDPATGARIAKEGEDARSSGEWYPPKKK